MVGEYADRGKYSSWPKPRPLRDAAGRIDIKRLWTEKSHHGRNHPMPMRAVICKLLLDNPDLSYDDVGELVFQETGNRPSLATLRLYQTRMRTDLSDFEALDGEDAVIGYVELSLLLERDRRPRCKHTRRTDHGQALE